MSKTGIVRDDSRTVARYAIILASGWTLLIAAMVLLGFKEKMQDARELIRNEARAHFSKDQVFRLWGASHGGVYVPPTDHTPPNPYLSHLPDRDIVTTDGKKLTLMNPAYMVRQLMEEYEAQDGVKGHITSLKPLRPENGPDEWERAALESFERGSTEANEFTEIDGKPYLRLMRPMIVEESCMKCHAQQGYQVGDVRGGVGVSVPAKDAYATARAELVEYGLTLGLLWLFGIVALVMGVRRILHRAGERDQAEAALRASEERLRMAQRVAHIGTWEWNLGDNSLIWSDETFRIFGLEPGEVTPTYELVQSFVHPEDWEVVNHKVQYAVEHDAPYVAEMRVVCKGGEKRELFAQGDIIKDDKGDKGRLLGTIYDITERKKNEEALIASEDRFRAITNQSSEGITVADMDGNYIFVNPAFCKMIGYSENELLQMTVFDVKAKDQDHSSFKQSKTSMEGRPIEVLLERKDGTEFTSEVVGKMIEINGAKCVLGTIQDITERKLAGDALAESESKLLEAQQIAHLGHYVLDLKTGRWTSSSELNVIFGIDEEYEKNVAGWLNMVHPDHTEMMSKYFETNVLGQHERFDKEYKIVDATSGQEKWVHGLGSLKLDEAGNPVEMFGTIQDITERKLTKEALVESEEKYRSIAERIYDVIITINLEGKITYVSPSIKTAFGFVPEELVGRNITEFVPKSEVSRVYETFKICAAGKDVEGHHFAFCKKDGSHAAIELNAVPIYKGQKIVGAQAIIRDITETKRLQELESRAQRLETAGTIAGQVAHDFNNLLAPLIAYPDFIRDELPKNHPALVYLDHIEKASHKIAEINQDLLTMGRRGHYNQEVLNLNVIVLQAVQELTPLAENTTVTTNLDPKLLNVLGGGSQIHRVITNLLCNAVDALQSIGHIVVTTENYYADNESGTYGRVPRGEYVKLTISDTGCGIPDDIVPKVLDPFFTTKVSDKKRGSGLGLSVVDAVVKDHGGYLDLDTKLGKGTSFYVYLPTTRESIGNSDADRSSGGNEKILVIDDDDMQREVSTRLLEKLGYVISTVESGEEAIEFLREHPQDLLIIDMVMPGGIDGAETYQQILQNHPAQKAIIVSGFSESSRVQVAQSLGAGAFVKKPLTRQVIALAVREELDRQTKNRV